MAILRNKALCNKNHIRRPSLLLSCLIKRNPMKRLLISLVSEILALLLASSIPDDSESTNVPSGSEDSMLNLSDSTVLAYCFTCHDPSVASHDEMLAPPLFGIRNHYLQSTDGRDDFIEKMTAFIMDPSEEKALMKGPVRRFGLMPRHSLAEEEVRSIVTYIHDNDIPAPSWYESHHQKKHGGPN